MNSKNVAQWVEMREPHPNTGNTYAQKGSEKRSKRFQVQLTPTACSALESLRRPGQSRNDALNELLERRTFPG